MKDRKRERERRGEGRLILFSLLGIEISAYVRVYVTTNFSFSIIASCDFKWTPFYPDFYGGCISLPRECIALLVGAFLETWGGAAAVNGVRGIAFTPRIVRRVAAYRYAEDKQMIRGRIKCVAGCV